MKRPAFSLALVLFAALPAIAQDTAAGNNFQSYMSYAFAHPYFFGGSQPVWTQCAFLYAAVVAVAISLFLRKGWRR